MLMPLMDAPGTMAPVESEMRPVMRPVATCAESDKTESKPAIQARRNVMCCFPLLRRETRPSGALPNRCNDATLQFPGRRDDFLHLGQFSIPLARVSQGDSTEQAPPELRPMARGGLALPCSAWIR